MRTFIPFEEALETVLSFARPTPIEKMPLSMALGHTLAEGVVAREDIPPFASSAMDGFAVRSEDFVGDPTRSLRITAHIPAGAAEPFFVEPGCTAVIMTGAPFPDGADAVIPVERVQNREGDRVSFNLVPVPGRHVRPAAEDVERGQQVFDAGELITPATLGMLATLGVDPVPVRRPPRVRIISTGDEIVEPSRQPVRGQIRNANGPALCAQVRSAGGQCPGHEHAFDSEAAIRECLFSGAEADLLVFSGGVSMGDHDHVRQVLESMGGVLHFWQVRQRPGKPLAFGLLGDQPFLGLPGNPVSSAMCFEIYVRPLIAHMLRRLTPDAGLLSARLDRTMDKVPDLHYFTRGTAWIDGDGMLRAGDTGPQGSNLYGSVVRANCIIHLPSDVERVLAGSTVLIQMLPWATLSGAPDTGVNP